MLTKAPCCTKSDLYFPNKSTVSIADVVKLCIEVGKAKRAHLLTAFELAHTILHTLNSIWAAGDLCGTAEWGGAQQQGTR